MPHPVSDHVVYNGAHALMTETALVLWEYTITFANEVDIFWRKPITATSLLFATMRWSMMVNALLEFAPTTEATSEPILLTAHARN